MHYIESGFMFIKSFLLFTKELHASEVSEKLNSLRGVEAWPSDNKDVIVMVTEFKNQKSEEEILEDIKGFKEVISVSLVSAYS